MEPLVPEIVGDEPASSDAFDVTFVIKAKHGALWKAVKKAGGQTALARLLGVKPHDIYRWVTLKGKPSAAKREQVEKKLFELTGKVWDELFPESVMTRDFLEQDKTREVSVQYAANQLTYDPSPAMLENLNQGELRERLQKLLHTLPERERTVVRLHYGLDDGPQMPFSEIGRLLKVSDSRVNQLHRTAIRKLQKPCRSQQLKVFLEP